MRLPVNNYNDNNVAIFSQQGIERPHKKELSTRNQQKNEIV